MALDWENNVSFPWDKENCTVNCMLCGERITLAEAHGKVTDQLLVRVRGEMRLGDDLLEIRGHHLDVKNPETIDNGGFYCCSGHAVASEL